MMPLGPRELKELRELVASHWTGFLAEVFGAEALGLDGDEIGRLVAGGYLDPAAALAVDPVQDAYLLGFYRDRLTQAGLDVTAAPWSAVKAEIARMPAPLTKMEEAAVAHARQWSGDACKALGNRMQDQIISAVNPEDAALREKLLEVIKDETATALARRETVDHLRSRLGELSGDWSRDWNRIATTELHTAQEQGTASYYEAEHGPDVLYSKIPNPDACPKCRAAYLDEDGRPKVFKLSDLRANGTNVGRKQRDWLPVVGCMHAWCACRGVRVPTGWSWGDRFELQPPGRKGAA